MGGGHYGAVYGCNNDRRKPYTDNDGKLRWYDPKDQKDISKWQKSLNRGGDFKVSMSTKVCSNHFAAGYRSDQCITPTLYLKGYSYSPKRNQDKEIPQQKEIICS